MLTKRERNFAVGTGLIVLVFLLDYWVVSPLLQSKDELYQQQLKLEHDLSDAQKLIKSSSHATRRWADFRASGLGSDPSMIESRMLNSVRSWSQESGLVLVSLRPDRASENKDLVELTFQANAEGSMKSIWNFLYKVETAQIPVRIREMQIASRTEGSDILTLELRLSVMWESKSKLTTASVNVSGKEQP